MTTLDSPEQISFFVACSVRGQLKLFRAGLRPSGGVTKTTLLKAASKITGRNYSARKPSDLDDAIRDVDSWISEQKKER